jgi:hypothetical protein
MGWVLAKLQLPFVFIMFNIQLIVYGLTLNKHQVNIV